ncbi:MAG: M48 family metalloprotease [Roseomonas mucosa]|nr:M48 family metalloprotease [Roseomonas mucosa]
MTRRTRLVGWLGRTAVPAVLALPVLFSLLGAWEIRRGDALMAEAAERSRRFQAQLAWLQDKERLEAQPGRPGNEGSLPLALLIEGTGDAVAEAEADLLVARLRRPAAWLTLVAALVAGAAGLAGMLLGFLAARRGERSRDDLVAAFARIGRLLPPLLAAQVAGAALAVAGAAVFEAGGLLAGGDPGGRAVVLGILVLVGAGLVLRGAASTLRHLRDAVRAFVPAPLALAAVPIPETRAPGLHALLGNLSRERGTAPPETVAAGAEAGFFVTALPVLLHGAPDAAPVPALGRTLHLSLPLLATLNATELRTVLAHELAHFSGEDTAYSARFLPIYAGLGQAAAATSLRGGDYWGSTWLDRVVERAAHPHTALAVHVHQRFGHAVARWSRLRELEADRAAIASGSAAALASSLLRLGLADELLRAERQALDRRPEDAPTDLAAALVSRVGDGDVGDAAAHLGDEAPHPTDSHPPARQRIEAAGVPVDAALLRRAARAADTAELDASRALFVDFDALSREVTGHLRDRARLRRKGYHTLLRETAAAAGGPEETVLHASLLRPVAGLALLGALCLALSAGSVLAALYGGDQDRAAWRFLLGAAAVGAVGLGFVGLWSVRLWRGRGRPYLILDAEGLRSPGFEGTVRWLDVSAVGVSAAQSLTTWFVLRPGAPLPRRTGLIRRLRIDQRERSVQFMTQLPRRLEAAALRDLLMRHAEAAHARHALAAESSTASDVIG